MKILAGFPKMKVSDGGTVTDEILAKYAKNSSKS